MTALAGALYCQYQMFISPDTVSGIAVSLQMVFAAIVGGLYVSLGPTVGAIITILLAEILRIGFGTKAVGWDNLVYGVLLVLFIIFLPKGILGSLLDGLKPQRKVPRAHEQETVQIARRRNLSRYVAPFRFDGSGKFHLKIVQDQREGRSRQGGGRRDHRGQPEATERFPGEALRAGPLVAAADRSRAWTPPARTARSRRCSRASIRRAARSPPSSSRDQELDHDFLWRSVIALPERGHIGIFNRSYYEECLVMRVHPEILAKQKLPPKLVTKNIWKERFEDISAFERYLARNGTVVLKFFLNVSKEEQRERFLDRLEEPAKKWKFSMDDIKERALWPRTWRCTRTSIRHTATPHAPWYVVPADHKWFARVVIGSAIVAAFEKLDLRFPRADKASAAEFDNVRKALEKEGKGKR